MIFQTLLRIRYLKELRGWSSDCQMLYEQISFKAFWLRVAHDLDYGCPKNVSLVMRGLITLVIDVSRENNKILNQWSWILEAWVHDE